MLITKNFQKYYIQNKMKANERILKYNIVFTTRFVHDKIMRKKIKSQSSNNVNPLILSNDPM